MSGSYVPEVIELMVESNINTRVGLYTTPYQLAEEINSNAVETLSTLRQLRSRDRVFTVGSSGSDRPIYRDWWALNDERLKPVVGCVELFFRGNVSDGPRNVYETMKSAIRGDYENPIKNLNEQIKVGESLLAGEERENLINEIKESLQTLEREGALMRRSVEWSDYLTESSKKKLLKLNTDGFAEEWQQWSPEPILV